ncbi:MAG: hypothetical protein JWM91_2648 [Rhodospirillales bacterium]|nr:hypothetical protein [Rhodospirillales bacterium]
MANTFYITAAAMMFASVAAFAQTPTDKTGAAPEPSASASAPADSTEPADMQKGKMHRHHHHQGARSGTSGSSSTDAVADKLNACMSNATPTAEQENCLRQAASS